MTSTESQAPSHAHALKSLAQTPEELVAAALKALQRRRRPTVVSGIGNSLFAFAVRVLPRRTILSMTGEPMRGKAAAAPSEPGRTGQRTTR
ncbi:hypothetical protein [Streptomyces sp. 3N207]|uniref:hypothetical protein n=1 Tax=Streptomyces sp. 3N207 TaxID=3457417 RepID=UPI003FD2FFE0